MIYVSLLRLSLSLLSLSHLSLPQSITICYPIQDIGWLRSKDFTFYLGVTDGETAELDAGGGFYDWLRRDAKDGGQSFDVSGPELLTSGEKDDVVAIPDEDRRFDGTEEYLAVLAVVDRHRVAPIENVDARILAIANDELLAVDLAR